MNRISQHVVECPHQGARGVLLVKGWALVRCPECDAVLIRNISTVKGKSNGKRTT